MHKLVFILVCCIHYTAISQDVITTKSGESIQAKIIEVSDENVSYKKYHDQQGATFILKTEKIKSIAWENGDVDEYKEVAQEQATTAVNAVNENNVLPYINKKFGAFHLDNGQVYDREQFQQFLIDKNLSHIWTKYSSGNNLLIAGWAVIGGGVMLGISGMMMMDGDILSSLFIGLPMSIMGVIAYYVGIPMAIVGAVRKNRAINDYNTIYAGRPHNQYSQHISIKAGCIGNGVGFSLHF
jgi:hypothetical protein